MSSVRSLKPLTASSTADTYNNWWEPRVYYAWTQSVDSLVEHVYSWRTGARWVSDAAPSDISQSGMFGIKVPRETGNLVERLADRKRYYEDLMRAAFPAQTASGAESTDRASTTDSGHLFAKVTALRMPLEFRSSWRTSGYPSYSGSQGTITSYSAVNLNQPHVQTETWMSYPYYSNSASLTTAIQRQGTANRFFSSTAPGVNTASLATTVVELLRGDIPSLLKNYRRALFNYRSKTRALRYVGGEYLNIQFGWVPLLQEYANVLKVLIGLDRMVYSETNRRQRLWDGPSTSSVNDVINRTPSDTPIQGGGGQQAFVRRVGTPYNVYNFTFDQRTQTDISENYYFSARYSSLAKPTTGSIGFVERAEEALRQLGLVDDPTILWNLTPYSWLVDWVANIGNSLVNAHQFAPLSGKHSVDYAYFTSQLTEQHSETPTKINRSSSGYDVSQVAVTREGYYSTVSRIRNRATPFGFGTQLGSISTGQFAILVALGLAKSR